jgi:hypothetical protein
LLSLEFLGLSLVVNNDKWLLIWAGLDLEWPQFDIVLYILVTEFSSDKSLSIENSVEWVSRGLILCGVSNESLVLSEGNVRWGGVKTLVVSNDFDLVVHPHSDAGVSGSEIDSDSSVSSHMF